MKIDRSLYQNPKLARAHSTAIHGIRGVSARRGTTTARRPLPTHLFRRTKMSGDNSVTRKRAPIGDPLNDEKWGDGQSVITLMIKRPVRKSGPWESTNLSVSKDGHKDVRGVAPGAPWPNNQ